MLIVHIIAGLHRGGAELMLWRLVSEDSDSNIRHEVICLGSTGPVAGLLEEAGIAVHQLRIERASDYLTAFFHLVAMIRRLRPDIVQTWMYHSDFLGGLAARAAGVRQIIWGVRISDIGPHTGVSARTRVIRKLCAWLSPYIPRRIVYVAHSARLNHEEDGYDRSKGVVIPNGYRACGPPAHGYLRGELGLSGDTILVGSVARVHPQKAHEIFIASAAMLARLQPSARFVLIGRGASPCNDELMEVLDLTGINDRFFLLGERSDVEQCLMDLDLFCMHSLSEGFPNAVAEAMCRGVPVVATDVGDTATLVGDTGFIVPPGNSRALSDAMTRLVGIGPDARAAMGRRAQLRVAENYSIEVARRRFYECYAAVALSPELARSTRPAGA